MSVLSKKSLSCRRVLPIAWIVAMGLRNRSVLCAVGDEIQLEYNQPAMPVPGQDQTMPILRVASVMHVRIAQEG